jgi:hypothetical protein
MDRIQQFFRTLRMALAFWRQGPRRAWQMAVDTRTLIIEEIDIETVRLTGS